MELQDGLGKPIIRIYQKLYMGGKYMRRKLRSLKSVLLISVAVLSGVIVFGVMKSNNTGLKMSPESQDEKNFDRETILQEETVEKISVVTDENEQYYTESKNTHKNQGLDETRDIGNSSDSMELVNYSLNTENAVDSMTQSRIDKHDSVIGELERTGDNDSAVIKNNEDIAPVGDISKTAETNNEQVEGIKDNAAEINNAEMWKVTYNEDAEITGNATATMDSGNQSYGSSIYTDFSQYVYTDDKGRTAFKYTGTGNSAIYIPEGVEVVAGFSSDPFAFNYDITYVHLPSTIKKCLAADFYNTEEGGYDTNYYNYLYQCPNLQTVEGGGRIDYMCNGNSVVRRGGIVVWSNSSKVPYDAQAYINYNNR